MATKHKQTTENPWDKYEKEFALGTSHNAAVTEIVDKGATIKLNEDITAFVPNRHLEKEDGKKLNSFFGTKTMVATELHPLPYFTYSSVNNPDNNEFYSYLA